MVARKADVAIQVIKQGRGLARRDLIGSAGAGLGLLATYPVRAHGIHAAFTVVEHNPRTSALEVIHRMYTQDVEIALTAREGRLIALESEPDAERLVANYLASRFSMTTLSGDAISLDWIGMRLQVDMVFAYQEAPEPLGMTGLSITDSILMEAHPGQINTVNVSYIGRTQTRVFIAGDEIQSVAFS